MFTFISKSVVADNQENDKNPLIHSIVDTSTKTNLWFKKVWSNLTCSRVI